MTPNFLSDEACQFLIKDYSANRWSDPVLKPKMIAVNEEYFRSIQRDSEFLEILMEKKLEEWESYDECVNEHDRNLSESEMEGEEYAHGNRFQT